MSQRFFRFDEARRHALETVPKHFSACAVVTLNRLVVVDASSVSAGLRK